MDGRVWPCAVALLAVEVLDKGGEGVEVAAGGVPADEDLAGVCAEVQGEHLLLVVHVDLDLLGRLGVGDGIAVADLDFGAVFAAGAEEGADDAFLLGGAAEGVVENGEDGLVLGVREQSRQASHCGCRIPGAGWRRSAGQSTAGRPWGQGRAGARDGGRSRSRPW